MADLRRARQSGARWLLGFVGAYALLGGLGRAFEALHHVLWLRGWIFAHADLYTFIWHSILTLRSGTWALLSAATFAVLGVALRRTLRRGGPERPAALVGLARKYPILVHGVLPAIVGALWLGTFTRDFRFNDSLEGFHLNYGLLGNAAGSALFALVTALAVRFGLRALAAETPAVEAKPDHARPLDATTFTAVAVTPTTRGLVVAMGVVSALVAVLAAASPPEFDQGPIVVAYILAALGAATLFRYVSRIVVGIDGVLVTGAGRTRVFGYARFDEVHTTASEILLVKQGRALVRLQLPADEAPRIGELAESLREAMRRADGMRNKGADLLVQAALATDAPSERLAASSHGRGQYRQPAVAREQLWEVLEGPLADAAARRVAAEALAVELDGHDRKRMRVAAEHSADPRVRVALERLAGDEEEEVEAGHPGLKSGAASSAVEQLVSPPGRAGFR